MCNVPIWLQYLQALATPAIALLAIVIGVMQWRTAHQKVALDLFDRRMQVYEEINSAIAEIMREGNATTRAILSFDKATSRAPFLFGPEVNLFLQQTRKRMVGLHGAEIRAKSDDDQIRGKGADAAAEIMMDLTGFYGEFAALVSPYFKMHQKASPF